MHPQRRFPPGAEEEGEGKSPHLLSYKRYFVSQTRASAGDIERDSGAREEGEES